MCVFLGVGVGIGIGIETVLDRIEAVLTKLGRRGYAVRGEAGEYATGGRYRPRCRLFTTCRVLSVCKH